MKRLSKIQASQRILKIAKHVAMVQASNNKLTPLEIAKVQKTVGMILAAADLDEATLNDIQALDNKDDGLTNKFQRTKFINDVRNSDTLRKNKNDMMKTPEIQKWLSSRGIRLIRQMKVRQFFLIIQNLLNNFQDISNPNDVMNVNCKQLEDNNDFDDSNEI